MSRLACTYVQRRRRLHFLFISYLIIEHLAKTTSTDKYSLPCKLFHNPQNWLEQRELGINEDKFDWGLDMMNNFNTKSLSI